MRLPLFCTLIAGMLALSACQTTGQQNAVILPPPKPEFAGTQQKQAMPDNKASQTKRAESQDEAKARAEAETALGAWPRGEDLPVYKPLTAAEAQAALINVFQSLDNYPLLTGGMATLRQWEDGGGRCAVAFTRDAQLALGTIDAQIVAFPVTEAVPVDCANLQTAYDAAVEEGVLLNIEKVEGGKPAVMRHVNQKRDALKRSFVKLLLAHQGEAASIDMHGMEVQATGAKTVKPSASKT